MKKVNILDETKVRFDGTTKRCSGDSCGGDGCSSGGCGKHSDRDCLGGCGHSFNKFSVL